MCSRRSQGDQALQCPSWNALSPLLCHLQVQLQVHAEATVRCSRRAADGGLVGAGGTYLLSPAPFNPPITPGESSAIYTPVEVAYPKPGTGIAPAGTTQSFPTAVQSAPVVLLHVLMSGAGCRQDCRALRKLPTLVASAVVSVVTFHWCISSGMSGAMPPHRNAEFKTLRIYFKSCAPPRALWRASAGWDTAHVGWMRGGCSCAGWGAGVTAASIQTDCAKHASWPQFCELRPMHAAGSDCLYCH